jgi:hypothetical protein
LFGAQRQVVAHLFLEFALELAATQPMTQSPQQFPHVHLTPAG